MLYMRCVSCGTLLGGKVIEFEKGKEKFCKNPNLTTEEKDIELTKLIHSLKLKRYCCKGRMMSYKDIVQYIIPVPNNE